MGEQRMRSDFVRGPLSSLNQGREHRLIGQSEPIGMSERERSNTWNDPISTIVLPV